MAISKDKELNIADLEQVSGGRLKSGSGNHKDTNLIKESTNSIHTNIKKERGNTLGKIKKVD